MQHDDREPHEPLPCPARPPSPAASTAAGGVDDDVLISRARHGDERAITELVRRHQPRLLRLARRRVRCRAIADDVLQLTLLRVLQALPRYEPRGKFRAYLRRVLDNQCWMANRSQDARDRAQQRAAQTEGEPLCSPDRELSSSTVAAVRLLTQHQRQVLLLRALQGFTFREIGVLLAAPEATVRRRYFDARGKLRQALAD